MLLIKVWSERHLPEELWAIILSNLPFETLLRFRSVSTPWRALIDSPDFARSHLARFPNNRHATHLLINETDIRCTATLKLTAVVSPSPTALSIPSTAIIGSTVISSVDGLLMLMGPIDFRDPRSVYDYSFCMLWNPSIRKARLLLAFPPIPNATQYLTFGLGFDPVAMDYKFVRLVVQRQLQRHGVGLQYVLVYSVGINSWKVVELPVNGCQARWSTFLFYFPKRNLCVRGFLFGLAQTGDLTRPVLVSFDLSTHALASTKLPMGVVTDSNGHAMVLSLANIRSSLVVVYLSPKGRGSIWVLEGVGDDRKSWSWSKRNNFASRIPEVYDDTTRIPMVYIGKDEVMLLNWNTMLTSYDLQTHKEKIIMKQHLTTGGGPAIPYIESLVLLN